MDTAQILYFFEKRKKPVIETLFRFDPILDAGEYEDNKEIILPQPYWY